MRILFCTDGSKISFDAIKNFRNWVEEATVDVISVIDWTFLPMGVSIEAEGFAGSCADIADNVIDFAESEVQKLGFNIGKMIKHCGAATENILEQLELEKYDYVVLGSHGKKGFKRWLGSVSQEIVKDGKTSAFISRKENLRKKVLFAINGAPHSLEGSQEVIKNLKLDDKEIYVCMVNEEPDLLFLEGTLDSNWLLSIEKEQQIYASKAIQEVLTLFEKNNLSAKSNVILSGNPAQKIIEYAKKEDIDLIVMCSKSKTKMKAYLNESISNRVLQSSESDMLLIKLD